MAAPEDLIVDVLIAERQKLLIDLRRRFGRVTVLYEQAERAVQRNSLRRPDVRRLLERHGQRRSVRQLQALIIEKLRTGRLPEASAPRIFGAPGAGGRCDACETTLRPTQLVMSVPWPSRKIFAQLHADCFMVWNAARHSPLARARIG